MTHYEDINSTKCSNNLRDVEEISALGSKGINEVELSVTYKYIINDIL